MKKEKEEWIESGYLTLAVFMFAIVAGWIWGWQAFVIAALTAWLHSAMVDHEWLQREAKSREEEYWQYIEWLRERLKVVDPSARGRGKGTDAWVAKDYTSNLKPPPNEVVGHCPKCNYEIKRRELGSQYNGGHRDEMFELG